MLSAEVRKVAIAVVLAASLLTQNGAGALQFEGVTVSCQTWGGEWKTPQMAETLDELKSLGIDSVAIHPYARITNEGRLRWRSDENHEHVRVPLRWMRERGLRAMLIPHIAYWGTKWLWRGEIDFASDQEWTAFFDDYQHWIVSMAKIAEEERAPLFCVGLEYTHAQKHEQRWREIIAAVRAVYSGKITYGANWNEYDAVPFWDAVDYLGVLWYFPLTKEPNPGLDELRTGFRERLRHLENFSRRHGGKQFVLVEIGYNESANAAAEPWSFKTGGDNAAQIQARCIEAALIESKSSEAVAGMFWWKWFADLPGTEGENYRLQKPEVKELLARYWR